MAAFLETIARRGAGLGLGGGATLAVPRPRVRFETGTASSGADFGDTPSLLGVAEETMSHTPAARGVPPRFLSRASAVDTRSLSPERPDPGTSFTRHRWKISPASVVPANAAQTAPPQVRVPRLPPRIPETRDPNAQQRQSLLAHDPTHESTRFDIRVPKSYEGSAPAQPAAAVEMGPETGKPIRVSAQPAAVVETDSEAGKPNRTSAPDQGIAPAPMVESAREPVIAATEIRVQERASELVLSLESQPRHEESQTVAVNIGRIEVEVAPPPTAPAPTQRMQPERTRGFAAYRNARHGRPR